MSRQSSLASFFGKGSKGNENEPERKSKKQKIQSKINTSTESASKAQEKEIEIVQKKKIEAGDELVDTDEEVELQQKKTGKNNKLENCGPKSVETCEKISLKQPSKHHNNEKEANAKPCKREHTGAPTNSNKINEIEEDDNNIEDDIEEEDEEEDDEEFNDDVESEEDSVMKEDDEADDDTKLTNLKETSKSSDKQSKPKPTGTKSAKPENTTAITLDDISWKEGDHVPFSALCETFIAIENISSRLQIQDILTQLFQKAFLTTPEDVSVLVYLASNTVAPAYDCVELGIGDSILEKAIGEASGTNPCT